MTDLDRVIAGVDIARKSRRRRKAQAFNAQEEPVVIEALFAADRIICGLMECALAKENTNASSDPSSVDTDGDSRQG